jgi:hypothetical protein
VARYLETKTAEHELRHTLAARMVLRQAASHARKSRTNLHPLHRLLSKIVVHFMPCIQQLSHEATSFYAIDWRAVQRSPHDR